MVNFNEYPYRNLTDLNLDYLEKKVNELKESVDAFITLNTIKYANPIQWDITKQYETNTIVINPLTGVAYLSTKPVPAGVSLSNTDYWTEVFNLAELLGGILNNLTVTNMGESNTATIAITKDYWLLWNNELYVALTDIAAGTALIPGTNIQRITVENYLMVYKPNQDKLIIKGVLNGEPIQTRGDYHVYEPEEQAIKIIKVE